VARSDFSYVVRSGIQQSLFGAVTVMCVTWCGDVYAHSPMRTGTGCFDESAVVWVDVPEFSHVTVASATTPRTQANPTARSAKHAATCGANAFYNYTSSSCVSRVHVAATNHSFSFTGVQVRWRSVPVSDQKQLLDANCAPFDTLCLKHAAANSRKSLGGLSSIIVRTRASVCLSCGKTLALGPPRERKQTSDHTHLLGCRMLVRW